MDKQLIIFPKGALTPKDRERMSKAGFLAIEADDPSKVVVALPGALITNETLLVTALGAMQGGSYGTEGIRAKFTQMLWDQIKAKHTP